MQQQPHMPEMRNLIIAVVLSTVVLLGWQFFIEKPKQETARLQAVELAERAQSETVLPNIEQHAPQQALVTSREQRIEQAPRVKINTGSVHGSVNLKGLRIDDLTLAQYKETIEDGSPEVKLLSPAGGAETYFAEFGWLSGTQGVAAPTSDSVWQTSSAALDSRRALQAQWNNGSGLLFEQTLAAKDSYLFEVQQRVTNNTDQSVTLYPYGLISRTYADKGEHFFILHEGPLGVFNDALTEQTYEDLRSDPKQSFKNTKGWLGITDKYWLTALIPDQKNPMNGNMSYFDRNGEGKYQVDYRGEAITILPGETVSVTNHFFAGAKQVTLLDRYGEMLNISLFDRAVDFGMLYFLTKPIFQALKYFNDMLGNFGLAIMLLTVCIKLVLFPLANKSYSAMSQMKLLMPKITEIRERYSDDKMKMNQEIMELYKREKVNPASGCLPMLLQIPVFFALYKVLFVTIEMRHAPFYGWIDDLSAQDPTSIFNLFGLIPWDPPQMLMIGAWPLIMCITMVLQQRLNPKPADPTQAMVLQWLPYIFLFIFASFPAGLVIYWAWNNTLSVIQQWVITQRHKMRYSTA